MALSTAETPGKGANQAYEIAIGVNDPPQACIREALGGADVECVEIADGALRWKHDDNHNDSKDGNKMWAQRADFATNYEITRIGKEVTLYGFDKEGTKTKMVARTFDKVLDAKYISVATDTGSTGVWAVCSYKCQRGIATASDKTYLAAGHLERHHRAPYDYWRSEFFPEIDKAVGTTAAVDFAETGSFGGLSLLERVIKHTGARAPWTKLRLFSLNQAGILGPWKALDSYKYAMGEEAGSSGQNPLYASKWGATFTAKMTMPKSEKYFLYTWADDGVKISINNKGVHKMAGVQNEMKWHMSQTSIPAGEIEMRVDYYQDAGNSGLWVMWSTEAEVGESGKCATNQPNQVACSKSFITVPMKVGGAIGPTDFSRCDASAGSLTMRAWKNLGRPKNVHAAMQLAQRKPDKIFIANSVYFENTAGYFAGLDAGFTKSFALRADGFFKAKTSGKYNFWLVSDNGSQLWIDNRNFLNENIPLTIDNDGMHAIQGIAPWDEKTKEMTLESGYYRFSAFMFDTSGVSDFEIYVQTPDDFGPRNINCGDFTHNTHNPVATYAYQGCYADNGNNGGEHDLPIRKGKTGVSVHECNELCTGYRFFGKQGDGECWCGDQYGTQSITKGSKDYPDRDLAAELYNPKSCKCEGKATVAGRQCVFERIIAGTQDLAFGKTAEASDAPKPAEAWRAITDFTNHGVMKNHDQSMSDTRSMGCSVVKVVPGKQAWWRVDFGDAHRVTAFSVTGVSDGVPANSNGLTARVGNWANNGQSDAKCAFGFNAFKGTYFKKCAATLSGRYFSLWNNGADAMVLCGVKVYGDAQDLAFGKETAQSTTAEGGTSARAVDGNSDGNFAHSSCTHTDGSNEQAPWWRVDLGSAAAIDSVTVFNRVDCCGDRLAAEGHEFEVRVGNDKSNFVSNAKCGDLHTIAGSATSLTVPCNKQSGRYVFIDIPQGKRVLTLCEVKVNGAHVTEDVASKKPCGQSSGENCAKALDGNINGNMAAGSCTATKKMDPAWWYVDLQDEYHVSSVHIYGRTDCCGDRLSNFQVRVGDTKPTSGALTNNRACNAATNNGKNDYNIFNLDNPSAPTVIVPCNRETGQYVSINIPDREDYLSLCEVKVFGQKSDKVRVNLAASKPAAQTSEAYGGIATKAVDGNTSGNFGTDKTCTHTKKETNPWWYVDLGKAAEVAKVVVYNRSDCCQDRLNDLQVRVGDFKDAEVVKNAKCGGRTSALSGSANINCDKQVGRYVSVDLEKSDAYLTICEVKVFGEFVEDGLALGKPTKQSSTANGGYSKRAVDGNTDPDFAKSSCSSTMKEDNPWWYVDLGKTAMVKKVAVYNRGDCCGDSIRNFEVRVGDVEPTSATLSSNPKCGTLHWGDAPELGGGQQGVGCDSTGRYVTVSLPGKDRILTICEVKVFGAYTTKAFSKCKQSAATMALELETSKVQFEKAQADIAALGDKAADLAKVKADLSKASDELEKAKQQAVNVAASGGQAIAKLKEMHALEIKSREKAAQGLSSQLALEKQATGDMAAQKEAVETKAAAAQKECTEKQEADAAAMEELKKSGSDAEKKCVAEAEKAAAEHADKYGTLEAKHKSATESAAEAAATAERNMASYKKTCQAKEADAREEGRKAGLQACPGVNGLMREIWRLRQQLGKAAAGEEEQ